MAGPPVLKSKRKTLSTFLKVISAWSQGTPPDDDGDGDSAPPLVDTGLFLKTDILAGESSYGHTITDRELLWPAMTVLYSLIISGFCVYLVNISCI